MNRKNNLELNIIFIHGYESSGHGFKGNFFRSIIPGILTPDFIGDLDARMAQLIEILGNKKDWFLIGSSFGGLMATIFASRYQDQVKQLILMAPALITPFILDEKTFPKIDVNTIVYHGKNDDVVSQVKVKKKLDVIFTNLTYNLVEDDHRLHMTTKSINWENLIII